MESYLSLFFSPGVNHGIQQNIGNTAARITKTMLKGTSTLPTPRFITKFTLTSAGKHETASVEYYAHPRISRMANRNVLS